MTLYFGIDIGGTSIKSAVVTDTGEILHKQSIETHPKIGIQDVCEKLKGVLLESLSAVDHTYDEVAGVGVGLPGYLDIEHGVIINLPNIGWRNIPFRDVAERVFNLPIVMDNDANLAAVGEAWLGAGRGASTMVLTTVGTGIGGGIVLNQRLHRGANTMAGEFGHMTVDRNGYQCHCGKHGCLETVASATAMIRRAKELQLAGQIPYDVVINGADDIFDLDQNGIAAARQVIHEAAHWLGYGLSLVATTINPDMIIVGGGVSKAGDSLLSPIVESFTKYSLPLISQVATIRLAGLGNDAGVIGAAYMVSQAIDS
ncbi:ROK family protein [Alicyclobacillus dauci]|uniref:Glucokinase n=1 Tax=Alicyclobacillus dauci TaxID=1475485 RepID=A0ABY6Z9E7_9BACL|nr:ROK family glucokinase [Alicyclobacillus dauci]WAH38886.1 ROK family glucokinase [Alicyclobacillus dauci]